MTIDQVLPPASVTLDIPISDKARALWQIAAELSAQSGIPQNVIEEALIAREALGSTGVGGGIALPHARLHGLGRTYAVFLRLRAPIDFEAADSRPVDLICGILAPEVPSAELLTALAAVSRVLRKEENTAALRRSHDPGEAYATLLGAASADRR